MRLTVAAIGRLKSGPEFDLVSNYAARIRTAGRQLGISAFELQEFEAPRGASGATRQALESELIAKAAEKATRRIVLDETGKMVSSQDLAALLRRWQDQGAAEIAFLIGGADGHDAALAAKADLVIAFGRATFPHMLVRVMLVEQIYRAMTILAGHPYHRA